MDTITAPKGLVATTLEGDYKMFDGAAWLLVNVQYPDTWPTDLTEDLESRITEITEIFDLCEEMFIDGSGLVSLNDLSKEYNLIEEELIRRETQA